MKKNSLELTWIGKNKEIKPEPRVLIEDIKKSYGDQNTENMLIHGDNLLALKAIEDKFTNQIKCIYIDPPYNANATGVPFDDNIKHSFWLNLMRERLSLLHKLLKDDGLIFVNIDDNEQAYLTVMMDEIFGRENGFDKISVKTSSSQGGFGDVNPGLVSNVENILVYVKDKNYKKKCFNEKNMFIQKKYDENYKFIMTNKEELEYTDINSIAYKELQIDEPYNSATWRRLKKKYGVAYKEILYNTKSKIALENKENVFRTYNPNKPSKKLEKILKKSKEKNNKNKIITDIDSKGNQRFILNGEVVLFYSKIFKKIGEEIVPAEKLKTLWDNISWEGISKEGGVKLRNSKKPERLIKRIIEISTKPNDIVLDSFLGSGTTCAVAHKMNRRWVGIELGEHCYTLCKKRLDNVINGEQSGISSEVSWKGGGGYKFYELAPSLLVKDKFGNWVISKKYNDKMLVEAMCKQEKFEYLPNSKCFWKQGKSSENDYLFVTTNYITLSYLQEIENEMNDNESLLICCKSYQEECEDKFDNISIKKIPQAILNNCEFDKDDYSLNVKEILEEEDE